MSGPLFLFSYRLKYPDVKLRSTIPSQADARLLPFTASLTTGLPESQASAESGAPKETAFDVQMSAQRRQPVQAVSTAAIVKPSPSVFAESAYWGQAAAQSPQAVHFSESN